MSADPRAALNHLFSAFERHLEASSTRHGDDDPSVVAAYEDLADAFEVYDGALYDAFGEMTPLDIYADDGEGEREDDEDGEDADDTDEVDVHDDEDGDDAHLYAGLDDDIDFDDDDDDDDDSDDDDSDDDADDGDDADDDGADRDGER